MNTKKNVWKEKPGDWFTLDELDSTGANYRIAMSQRGPGKTYAFKKKWIDEAFDSGFEKQAGYIRRTAEEAKPSLMGTLFDDIMDYMLYKLRISRPEIDSCYVLCRNDKFTLYAVTEQPNGDILKERIGDLGYYFCLARSQYYKSGSYPKINKICFDEAIPEKGKYTLHNEFETFLNLLSTIKRQRTDMTVYMFGNTVNLQAQLFSDMGIDVRKLTKGAIKYYEYVNDEGIKNSVAVQWSRKHIQSEESSAFYIFNNAVEKAILDGDFSVDEVPKDDYPDVSLFKHRAFIIRKDAIKLFFYQYKNDDKWYVTNERLGMNKFKYWKVDMSETYITTNMKRRIIGGNSLKGKKIINTFRNIHNYGLMIFNNNITGDDTSYILK